MPKKIWFLAFFSGLLLIIPWYENFSGFFLHFALVPLFIAEDIVFKKKHFFSSRLIFLISFLAFFTWNIGTMWWVSKITDKGALLSYLANSMFFATVFWAYYLVKVRLGELTGWFALVFFWLAFEFYCLHAEFAQPWLLLGNGLVNNLNSIQWYEYTGVLGGSLWLILGNILIFKLLQSIKNRLYLKAGYLIGIGLVLWLMPYFISKNIYKHQVEKGDSCKVVLIQPNVDPYTEKFTTLSQNAQLARIISLADSVKEDKADYYLAPESAIDNDIWESALWNNYSMFTVRKFISNHPNSCFLIGAITYNENQKEAERKVTTRFDPEDKIYFDAYNSALQIDTSFYTSIYHKSKLVLGVEKVPFAGVAHFFDKYLLKLGGSEGSLGQQDEPEVFTGKNPLFRPAPVICFESVYGEYITKYVLKGANLIFIITNDGWWDGTPGYIQHFKYSQLRAIETRRNIARCGNTGISGFINSRGEVLQTIGWWKRTALVGEVQTNSRITFYTKHGDYIGRIALALSALIVLITIISRFWGKYLIKNKKD